MEATGRSCRAGDRQRRAPRRALRHALSTRCASPPSRETTRRRHTGALDPAAAMLPSAFSMRFARASSARHSPRGSSRAMGRPSARAAASSPADNRGRCRPFAPIPLRPRRRKCARPIPRGRASAPNIRFSAGSRPRTCSRAVSSLENRVNNFSGMTAARRKKNSMTAACASACREMASTSCSSCCNTSAAKRSSGASATTAQTSRSIARNRGAPAPGTLAGTPRTEGGFLA